MRLTTYFFSFLILILPAAPAAAFTVGGQARPTFSTAPEGNVRPSTAATGAARPSTAATGSPRPTTPAGNSGNRFTPAMGETHPTTPTGLSAQRFTPSTGPVRPGLEASSGRAEAFGLAPRPSKAAAKEDKPVKQPAAAASGLKAAKLGGGAGGMGAMTAQQQKERDRVATNSDAASKLAEAKNYKATEEKAMSNIKGIMDAVNGKNSKINEKASSARKRH